MSLSSKLLRTSCIAIAMAMVVPVAILSSHAQEQANWQLFVSPPENARAVWSAQARHVASELELEREVGWRLVRTYISARQEHLKKIEALPREPESMRQYIEIRDASASALEESLMEALGEENGKRASALLGGFSFFFDHMVADILAAQDKALSAVFKYEEASLKAMKKAREAGSWEGLGEILRPAIIELAGKATSIYSGQQVSEWQEKYGWFFERFLSE